MKIGNQANLYPKRSQMEELLATQETVPITFLLQGWFCIPWKTPNSHWNLARCTYQACWLNMMQYGVQMEKEQRGYFNGSVSFGDWDKRKGKERKKLEGISCKISKDTACPWIGDMFFKALPREHSSTQALMSVVFYLCYCPLMCYFKKIKLFHVCRNTLCIYSWHLWGFHFRIPVEAKNHRYMWVGGWHRL